MVNERDGRTRSQELTLERAIAQGLAFVDNEDRKRYERIWKRLSHIINWEKLTDLEFDRAVEGWQEYVFFILEQKIDDYHGINSRVSGPLRQKQILVNKILSHILTLAIQKLRATMKQREVENEETSDATRA